MSCISLAPAFGARVRSCSHRTRVIQCTPSCLASWPCGRPRQFRGWRGSSPTTCPLHHSAAYIVKWIFPQPGLPLPEVFRAHPNVLAHAKSGEVAPAGKLINIGGSKLEAVGYFGNREVAPCFGRASSFAVRPARRAERPEPEGLLERCELEKESPGRFRRKVLGSARVLGQLGHGWEGDPAHAASSWGRPLP